MDDGISGVRQTLASVLLDAGVALSVEGHLDQFAVSGADEGGGALDVQGVLGDAGDRDLARPGTVQGAAG